MWHLLRIAAVSSVVLALAEVSFAQSPGQNVPTPPGAAKAKKARPAASDRAKAKTSNHQAGDAIRDKLKGGVYAQGHGISERASPPIFIDRPLPQRGLIERLRYDPIRRIYVHVAFFRADR